MFINTMISFYHNYFCTKQYDVEVFNDRGFDIIKLPVIPHSCKSLIKSCESPTHESLSVLTYFVDTFKIPVLFIEKPEPTLKSWARLIIFDEIKGNPIIPILNFDTGMRLLNFMTVVHEFEEKVEHKHSANVIFNRVRELLPGIGGSDVLCYGKKSMGIAKPVKGEAHLDTSKKDILMKVKIKKIKKVK